MQDPGIGSCPAAEGIALKRLKLPLPLLAVHFLGRTLISMAVKVYHLWFSCPLQTRPGCSLFFQVFYLCCYQPLTIFLIFYPTFSLLTKGKSEIAFPAGRKSSLLLFLGFPLIQVCLGGPHSRCVDI